MDLILLWNITYLIYLNLEQYCDTSYGSATNNYEK